MKTILLFLMLVCGAFAQEYGVASHYSVRSNGGTHTASGIVLRDDQLTAAHPKFPFGTIVKVTNLKNKKSVNVKIINRGPFATDSRGKAIRPLRPHPKRIIDLSQAAAKQLGFHKDGLTKVKVEVVKKSK